MTKKELNGILKRHKHWLSKDCDGWENMRADLRYADLSNADLRYANLRHADLRHADLSNADLSNAGLSNADLSNADLRHADPSNADLRYANLRYANLGYADLSNAGLSNADLSNAGLRHADLSNAGLDYSCIPLWCGSLTAYFDDKQIKQITYHLVKAGLQSKNTSDEVKQELRKLIDLANGFHRAKECGVIE